MIGRKDLSSPGYVATQAMHSAIQFCFQNPEVAKYWHSISNYLGFLSVENEEELIALIDKAKNQNIKFSVFREPDLNNQITSITLEPGVKSRKLCSRIPLALKKL